MTDRRHSNTEFMDPDLLDLDLRSTDELLGLLANSQARAMEAVRDARTALEAAVSAAAAALASSDGRLVLVGAGASGRIAVQDGAELWPTYGWPDERLLLVMAGGVAALTSSVDAHEDSVTDADRRLAESELCAEDVVVAVAASGRSPWTVRWLQGARERGAVTIGFANNPDTPLLSTAEHPVFLDSGPEVLAGSTRMAAGTAQKVALNLFTTALMIRLNRTFGNLMVDMAARNAKLDTRRIRMVQQALPGTPETTAQDALAAADNWVKLAIVMVATDEPAEACRQRLARFNGSLRAALAEPSTEAD